MYASKTDLRLVMALLVLSVPAFADTPGETLSDSSPLVPSAAQNVGTSTSAELGAQTTAIRIITTNVAGAAKLVADHHGLTVEVSDAVRGDVTQLLLEGDVDQMMSVVGTEANIDWFVYGDTLIVSARRENVTRFIPIGDLSMEFVNVTLAASEIDAERLGLLHIPDSSAVRVSGPPRAVEVVEAVLSLAEEQAPVVVSDAIVVRRGIVKSLESYGPSAIQRLANTPPTVEPIAVEETETAAPETDQTEQGGDES